MDLITKANIDDPDGFYNELIAAQRAMDDEEAAMMNAKLIILLANHIGDRDVLSDAILKASARSRPMRKGS